MLQIRCKNNNVTKGTLGTGQRFTPKKTDGSCNLL